MRGNSRTRSAWAFMRVQRRETRTSEPARPFGSLPRARRHAALAPMTGSTASPLLAQLLFRDGTDRSALGAPLELRHHLAHHRADVLRAAGDCRAHGGA